MRAVVTGADDDRARSGSVDPLAAEAQLASDPALGEAERRYGRFGGLPRVRRYDLPAARPLVRIEPSGPGLVVDGSAEALAGLAALRRASPQRADPLRGRRRAGRAASAPPSAARWW